jgi:hypothetical protein
VSILALVSSACAGVFVGATSVHFSRSDPIPTPHALRMVHDPEVENPEAALAAIMQNAYDATRALQHAHENGTPDVSERAAMYLDTLRKELHR